MRWLNGRDTIYNIGGRSTDISQIGNSLGYRLKEIYPINGVPQNIVVKLTELQLVLVASEKLIAEFIQLVEDDISHNIEKTG